MDRKDLKLYAVSDRTWLKEDEPLEDVIKELIEAGVTCIQLREKNLSDEEFEKEAIKIKAVCDAYNVPFIINDRVDICQKIKATGVHVGLSDMGISKAREILGDDFIIGGSAHNVNEALEAQRQGANYIGCGAVFGSSTKTDATKLEIDELKKITQSVTIPVVAIGGISLENIVELYGSGIDGIAVISGLFKPQDKKEATKQFLKHVNRMNGTKMKTALSIAGSDSSGGAGIQADLKTMQANGVFGMTAITALTAQNTTGVQGIYEVTPEFLGQQLDSVFTDIYPDAIKIGMVSSRELIEMIASKLKQYDAKNIVVDPVMVATSGSKLIVDDAIETLKSKLLPLATVVTPNIPEAEILANMKIKSADDMVEAAKYIHETYHCAVLVKGGHQINDANDLLYKDGKATWFNGKRVNNTNTHGTGCTLSSAIASHLAKEESLTQAVQNAKTYISNALMAMLDLGQGSGPMNHGFMIE